MPQFHLILPFAVLVFSPALAVSVQTGTAHRTGASVKTNDRVLNAPYSAQRRFTSISKGADGASSRAESGGSEARDSQGRTYSAGERQWTYMDSGKSVLKSELLYRIDDPVAKTETRWDSTVKEVKVIHFPQGAAEENKEIGAGAFLETTNGDSFLAIEKLGRKVIEGVEVEGERRSYTLPVGTDHDDHPIVVVHETWYCPELKIVVLETNDDPRSGQTTNQLVNIIRGEPDLAKYGVPADYVVKDIQIAR